MSDVADVTVHIPVLLRGVLNQLNAQLGKGDLTGMRIVDGTFGGGGYTTSFLELGAEVVGIDRDPRALARRADLQQKYADKLTLVHSNFSEVLAAISKAGWQDADAIVVDLGLSSDQLDTPERGFSYQKDGPLDMRMDTSGRTAQDILERESEQELVRIFREYGEDPKAKPLAKRIVEVRRESLISTTHDLLAIIEEVYPPRTGLNRRHPAQRIFQGLRIAVNDELRAVETFIPAAIEGLAVGGKLMIVSFHSLEDRMVKRAFKALCEPELDMVGRLVAEAPYKQPIRKEKPSKDEVDANVRARSATLRVIERMR